LDIGCGAGQTLIAAFPDQTTFGLDMDFNALRLGCQWTPMVCFAQGRAEQLPYRNETFGMVIARVSLPYTDLNESLREIHRVLKPGGKLWATMHPFRIVWRQMLASNYKGMLFFTFVVFNSFLLHVFQRQIRVLNQCETFQTNSGMRRMLQRAGFTDINIQRGEHFLVTACRN
jgi:ubiquinone/menaquinone biosynthesis C-methylase UbiE